MKVSNDANDMSEKTVQKLRRLLQIEKRELAHRIDELNDVLCNYHRLQTITQNVVHGYYRAQERAQDARSRLSGFTTP